MTARTSVSPQGFVTSLVDGSEEVRTEGRFLVKGRDPKRAVRGRLHPASQPYFPSKNATRSSNCSGGITSPKFPGISDSCDCTCFLTCPLGTLNSFPWLSANTSVSPS